MRFGGVILRLQFIERVGRACRDRRPAGTEGMRNRLRRRMGPHRRLCQASPDRLIDGDLNGTPSSFARVFKRPARSSSSVSVVRMPSILMLRILSSMPISSHCFCPCDKEPATRSRWSLRRVVKRMRSMVERTSGSWRANRVEATRRGALAASSRLSSTVWFSNTVGFWNLRPMPSVAISASSSRVRSYLPSNIASPSSGRVLPVMTSIIVVLPAPLGPMIARISPGARVSDRLRSAL